MFNDRIDLDIFSDAELYKEKIRISEESAEEK